MTWTPHRRLAGPAALVAALVRRTFGPADHPASGYEYAEMSEAGYHASAAPRPEDAPRVVIEMANELTAAKAVDEGHGHMLDRIVRSWGENWCDEELRQHNTRASILRLHARNSQAWRDRWQDHVAQLEEELGYAEAQLNRVGSPQPRQRPAPQPRPPAEAET